MIEIKELMNLLTADAAKDHKTCPPTSLFQIALSPPLNRVPEKIPLFEKGRIDDMNMTPP